MTLALSVHDHLFGLARVFRRDRLCKGQQEHVVFQGSCDSPSILSLHIRNLANLVASRCTYSLARISTTPNMPLQSIS